MDDLRGGYDIYVKGSSTLPVNKQTYQQMWLQLINLAAKVTYPDGQPIGKTEKLFKDALYSFDIPDPDSYINTPTPPAPPVPPEIAGVGVPGVELAPPSEADNLNQGAQPVNFGVNATE